MKTHQPGNRQPRICSLSIGLLAAWLGVICMAPTRANSAELESSDKLIRIIEDETVEIPRYLDQLAKDLGIGLIIPEAVQNCIQNRTLKLNNVSKLWVPTKDLFEARRAILKTGGFALLRTGPSSCPLYEVVDLRSGSTRTTAVRLAKLIPRNEVEEYKDRTELVRVAIPLNNINIARARTELNNLVSPQFGSINVIHSINTIVITEFGPVVHRICRMLEQMDAPSSPPQQHVKGDVTPKKAPSTKN